MHNWFLRAPAWQVFGLLVALPLAWQLGILAGLTHTLGGTEPLGLGASQQRYGWLPLLLLSAPALTLLGTLLWLQAIGTALPLPTALRPSRASRRWFEVALAVPLLYMKLLLVGALVVAVRPTLLAAGPGPVLLVVGPLHLLSIGCLLYCLYFAARTLRTVELGRPARLADFAGEFLLLWLYFIGIWAVQPRLNRLAAQAAG